MEARWFGGAGIFIRAAALVLQVCRALYLKWPGGAYLGEIAAYTKAAAERSKAKVRTTPTQKVYRRVLTTLWKPRAKVYERQGEDTHPKRVPAPSPTPFLTPFLSSETSIHRRAVTRLMMGGSSGGSRQVTCATT